MFQKTLLAGAVWLFCATTATATSLSFNFSQTGFTGGGGTVTGMFVGQDINGDGQLGFGEVSDASMQFSGNNDVTAFTLDFDDLFGLVYDLDGGPLGDGLTGQIEGIGFDGLMAAYEAGPGPVDQCGIGVACAFVTDGMDFSTSKQLVIIGGGGAAGTTNTFNSASTSFTTGALLTRTAANLSGSTATRSVSTLFSKQMSARVGSSNVATFDLGAEQGAAAGDLQLPAGAWMSVTGTEISDNFVTTAFDSDVFTFTGGMDWLWEDRFVFGMALGYEKQDTDTIPNSGEVDSDNFSVIPYAGYLINDFLSADVSVGGTWLDIDQNRSVGTLTFDSSTSSTRYFVAGNLNVVHTQGPWLFTGTAGVLYAKENVEDFTERLRGTPSVTIENPSLSARIGQWRFGASGAYYIDGWEPFVSAYYINDFTTTDLVLTPGLAKPSNDDDEVQLSAGLRYLDESLGVTASVEIMTVAGRDNIDSTSANFLLRIDM